MTRILIAVVVLALAAPVAARAESLLLWGVQVDQLEYRLGDGEDMLAWEGDGFVGTDELKLELRSRAEWGLDERAFETMENQARLRVPVSDFFDASAGIAASTPGHGPDRLYGVVGIEGLAPQWFELHADAFLSDRPFLRGEAEYEALLTNRLILTPRLELDLPLADDDAAGMGAWGPTMEIGARLGYDLIDRLLSPYVGVHYERAFGATADLRRADGEDRDALYVVIGTRMMF